MEQDASQVYLKELYEVLWAEFIALGLLGFEESDGEIQARSMLFPWHSEDARRFGLFTESVIRP